MLDKVFFQSSMPRSGSTLLQNILGSNPDLYATPTDGALELVYAARANFSSSPEFSAQDPKLMREAFKSFCKGGLEGYCNALIEGTGKTNVILKSRGWGKYKGFLDTFYPDAKVICMVRDLKDVVASYEKIYRNNQHLHDPINNDLEGRGGTVEKRIDEWMRPTNTIGRAIERILGCIQEGQADSILFVKYEDLALHPEAAMARIYNYLQMPHFYHNFDNIEQITQEDDTAFGMGDLHTIRQKLEMKPSDANFILGANVTNWLYQNYEWYYRKFNYKK